MKIGTIETLEEDEAAAKKSIGGRSRFPRSGSTGGGGGGDGSDGSDGDGGSDGNGGNKKSARKRPNQDPWIESTPEKSRVFMWFLLLVVIMTFGGLIGAYVVISTNSALEWRPFELPVQVWVSTIILLASSFVYDLSRRALEAEKFAAAKKYLLLTTALGGIFIASQILAWMVLVQRGLYMSGNPYAGFFYILTAVHVVHVIGGICALGYLTLRTWHTPASDFDQKKNVVEATVIGWYWHTMDALWLVLLFLLGFFK